MPNYVTPVPIQNGQVSNASQIDTLVGALEDLINVTLLDGDNFQDNSITSTELASNSITEAKIAPEAITYDKLASAVQALVTPVGSIMAYYSTTPPSGYLYCDGSTVSRLVYSDLYSVLGTAYGSGDGVTTFHLPDLRGRFLRGVDGSTGRDPGASSRTAMNTGGNTGDAVGSVQGDATALPTNAFTVSGSGEHTHPITVGGSTSGTSYLGDNGNINNGTSPTLTSDVGGSHAHTSPTTGGDADTRPVNVAVAWMVKY